MTEERSQAGECTRCGNYLPLNEAGLCPTCQNRPACHTHPDRDAVGRCKVCKDTFCRACMPQRLCSTCESEAPKAPRPKGPKAAAAAAAAAKPTEGVGLRERLAKVSRKHLLIGLGSLLVLIQVGFLAWNHFDQPASTQEERMVQKLNLVRSAVKAYKAEKNRIPKNAEELRAFLKEVGMTQITLVGAEGEAGPGVVIYRLKGRGYEVFAKDEEGKVFRRAPSPRGRATPAPAAP